MREEMKNNLANEELNREQLDGVSGGEDRDSKYEYDGSGGNQPYLDPRYPPPSPRLPSTENFDKCPVCGAPKSPKTYGRPNICPQCKTPYEQ